MHLEVPSEEPSERCPAPDLIALPVMLLGLTAPVVLGGVALIAEPVIRHTHWLGVPKRPPRVVLQRFLL
jgi:hypothetical protein